MNKYALTATLVILHFSVTYPGEIFAAALKLATYFAGAGSSETSRRETLNSSSWKCGRKNITERYTPGFPGTSETSTRASRSGQRAFIAGVAVSSGTTYRVIQRFRNISASVRDMKLPILSRIIAFK
jgi:hypothetical protein